LRKDDWMADLTIARGRVAAAESATAPRQAAPITAAFLLLLAAAAVPLFSVKLPAMVDYPDHLGRLYTIAHLGDDPLLARFYSVDWKIIPNLGVDLLLPLAARHLDIYLAGKLCVFLCMLLWLTGPMAIHAALYRRLSPGPLVAFLFIYNWIFLYGFLNYLLGVGLALWAIAAWIGLRRRHPLLRGLVSLAFILALFACHLFTLGLYGVALLAYEASMWRQERRTPPARGAVLAFALPFLVVPALMLASPTTAHSLDVKWTLEAKFFGPYYIIKTYSDPLDLAVAAIIAAAAFLAWRRRILVIHPVVWYLLAIALPVYLVMPDVLFGSWAADRRLPIAILFIVIGFLRWDLATAPRRAVFLGLVALLSLARFTAIDQYWRWYDRLFAQFEDSYRAIAPGSRVLVGQLESPSMRYAYRNFLNHVDCLVMIERSSMATTAFTNAGKQVLAVNPPYRRNYDPIEGPPPTRAALVAEAEHPRADPPEAMFWSRWPQRYDYLLLLYQPELENPLPDLLAPLYQGEQFTLFRITRRGAPAAGGW
jgi:hypothetical protein